MNDFVNFDNSVKESDLGGRILESYNYSKGVNLIKKAIKEIIGKYTNFCFFEYTVIGTTLDYERKLLSICCVDSLNDDKNVDFSKQGDRLKQVLDFLSKNDFDNWYHNPELFIKPRKIEIRHSFRNHNLENGTNEKLIREFVAFNKTREVPHCFSTQNGLCTADLTFKRSFETMVDIANQLSKQYTIDELNELCKFGHNASHTLYDYVISPNMNTCYITFPIIGGFASNLPAVYKKEENDSFTYQGIGTCFIYFAITKDTKQLIDNIEKIKLDLFLQIGELIRLISYNYIFNIAYNLSARAINEAIRSAKAAIMSRNMSHNLGSHVMFYIKQKLQSVSKIVNGDVLKNIIPGDVSSIEEVIKKVKQNKGIELPFLVGLGKFINYLQERQDYIATIATDYIPANSTISFKDFIYDELKPDLRYKRHHPKEKLDDVSDDAGTEPGNLLLDYIAYSEGYTSSDMIELKFGEFDGEKPQNETQAYADFEELRKFNIAVPGGVVGRQAIFSIIENIIRNAAKHCARRSDGRLSVLFTMLDEKALSDILVRTKMKESKCEFRCKRSESSEIEWGESLIEKYRAYTNDYHILSIKLDMPNNKNAIDDLVEKLGGNYVNPNGVMKDSSKGLKEMRISAAWLRGCSIDTKIDDKEPPVLSVLSEPMDNSDYYTLAYILCIPKPRKIAFVVDDEMLNGHQSEYNTLCTHIRPYGCDIFKVSDMLSSTLCKVPNYDIVCLCTDEKREDIICKISSRYISNKDISLAQLDALYNFIASHSKEQDLSQNHIIELDKKIESIYEVWFDEWYKMAHLKDDISGKKHRLVILDAKAIEKKKSESDVVEEGLVTLTTTGKSRSENCENAVIYSTHFKGLKNEDSCSKFINAASVESVTGNNSTDRLIRQDEWTKEWMSKHLAAGLSKVAIFDERIFSTFIQCSGIDEKSIDSCLSEFFNKPTEQHTNSNLIQLIKKRFSLEFKVAKEIVNNANGNQDELKRQIVNYSPRNYNTDIAQINHERRIWAYDIRCFADKDEPRVDIVGYTAPIRNNVGAYNQDNTINERIASIVKVKDDNKYKVEIYSSQVFPEKNGQVFDYITIHQGILDKIYTTFGIKTNQSEMFKITNALHKAFSKHATPDDLKKFLPNFIIHSGRSKPNFVDMPQQQPFVQFAAIEQAVKDCKYTLVELLTTAHYENSGNN